MKIDWNSKYTTISAYAVITFLICLAACVLVSHLSEINGTLKTIVKVLSPLIWGVVIAYLLNPIMMKLQYVTGKLTGIKKPHPKLDRVIATILSVLIFLAMISALVAIIFPQLVDSIMGIFNNFPSYMNSLEKIIDQLLVNYPDVLEYMNSQFDTIQNTLMGYVKELVPKIGDLTVKIKDGALTILLGLKDFLIGIIAAVYFLLDKEKFQSQMKKTICALFPKKFCDSFFSVCSRTNKSFSGFISGKIVDSIIIGILCFVSMKALRLDYALLISVIIGVTNIIPFFGPIFGAIPSALLLLVSSPIKQLIIFVILIIVLQQLDGNIIGPKILGDSTGLSAFWVMFAIIVGGGLFGFPGMVLAVPTSALIYSFFRSSVEGKLKRKNLPTATDYYKDDVTHLYTKPPERTPLTKEELLKLDIPPIDEVNEVKFNGESLESLSEERSEKSK